MRKALAITRANWLTALSYRMDTFFSLLGMFAGIIPLYFISRALQPLMAGSIRAESPEYFGFLVVGLLTFGFIQTSVGALHTTLSTEISTGSFEALLGTPTPLPVLLTGMIGQAFSMTAVRSMLFILFAWVLGAHVVWKALLASSFILLLITVSYIPFGVIAAALILAFRTTGPFPTGILVLSSLLGGVYYPTQVIPSWLERCSTFVPLTYGLRSLRRSLLEGAPIASSAYDLAIVAGCTVVMGAVSMVMFVWALRYAKHAGTLAQY